MEIAILEQTGIGIANTARVLLSELEGLPYRWGGKDSRGFDCSGFVSYVLELTFPSKRSAFRTDAFGLVNLDLFTKTSRPAAGDLIFFKANPEKGLPNHIGIMLNCNLWVGAQSSTGLASVDIKNKFWASRQPEFYRTNISSTQAINSYLSNPKQK